MSNNEPYSLLLPTVLFISIVIFISFKKSCPENINIDTVKANEELKLSQDYKNNSIIPFYIYDFPETNWYTLCLKSYPWLNYSLPSNLNKHWFHHSDDFIFNERILKHGWRVFDPEQAEIFILPTLFSFFTGFGQKSASKDLDDRNEIQINLKNGYDWNLKNLKCNGYDFHELVKMTVDFLDSSEIFQKYGNLQNPNSISNHDNQIKKPHLLVNSHWFFHEKGRYKLFEFHPYFLEKILPNFSIGTFESVNRWNFRTASQKQMMSDSLSLSVNQRPWKCSIFVPYVEKQWSMNSSYSEFDKSLEDQQEGFESWKNREFDFFFVGRLEFKRSYETRRMVADSMPMVQALMDENSKTARERIVKYLVAASYEPVVPYFNGKSKNDKSKSERLPYCDFYTCFVTPKTCKMCRLNKELQLLHDHIGLNSKFALIIHGDTSSTSRLYDAIFNGLIPIIISPTLFLYHLPFQTKVPWRDIAFHIPLSSINSLVDSSVIAQNLYNILNYPEDLVKHKFERMVEMRKELSWLHPESRIVENILRDTKNDCDL